MMFLSSPTLSFSSMRLAVSVFGSILFHLLRHRDTAGKWQARKAPFLCLLSLKLVASIALAAIETHTKSTSDAFAEMIDILLLVFQIDEILFCETHLSWKAYKGTWAVMLLFETLTIGKLTMLPHPSMLVPACLSLALVRFCLSCAVLVLFVQVQAPKCDDIATKKDNKHHRPWDWEAVKQIYIIQFIPGSWWEWLALILPLIFRCWETDASIQRMQRADWILEKAGLQLMQQQQGLSMPSPEAQTFLRDSCIEFLVEVALPIVVNFISEIYYIQCRARVEKLAIKHIILLDKQSFDKNDVTYKESTIQKVPGVTMPIQCVMTELLPSLHCLIRVLIWLSCLHGMRITTVVWTIVGLKAILGARFARKYDDISQQRTDNTKERMLRRNDAWHGRNTFDLNGQLENKINEINDLINKRFRLDVKILVCTMMRKLIEGFMKWGGHIIAACIAFGYQVLYERHASGIGPTYKLYRMVLMVNGAADSFLSAPGTISKGCDLTEQLRHMIATKNSMRYGNMEFKPGGGSIKFNNVSFWYERGEKVFDKFNLTIKKGMRVAIVGPSGCGKSTLVDLLTGQVSPTEGSVEIDGQDIRDLKRTELSKHINTLEQRPYILNGSFEQNIRMGNPNATRTDITEAAKKACIHDYIMTCDKKYDSMVGHNGSQISGGQQQRLGIARMHASGASIYIYDESFNSLDPPAIEKALSTIENTLHDNTVIYITHQREVMGRADIICCITDDGVELGTLTYLLKQQGHFWKLWYCRGDTTKEAK